MQWTDNWCQLEWWKEGTLKVASSSGSRRKKNSELNFGQEKQTCQESFQGRVVDKPAAALRCADGLDWIPSPRPAWPLV